MNKCSLAFFPSLTVENGILKIQGLFIGNVMPGIVLF